MEDPVNKAIAANANDATTKDSIDDVLQFSLIRDEAKQELLEALDSVRGRKCLFVDPHLGHLINQVIGDSSKFFKENAVQYYKELHGDISEFINEMNRDAPENILYLVRPHLPNMKEIAQQIRAIMQIGIRCQFRIYFVPNQSTVCLHLLEEQIGDPDMWERISFKECKLGFIPLDSDLLSLEMDYVFKQCYVDGDLSCLNIIAQSLIKFQNMFGIIPNIRSKGVAARKVLQRMMHRRFEEEESAEREGSNDRDRSEVDTLVILDREIDLTSPLVTPLTYEGLVDEIIGIRNGKIKVEASLLGSDENNELAPSKGSSAPEPTKKINPGDMVTLVLNNNDSIFAEIRNLSIERIGSYMQEKAIHIRERYAAFKGNKDASLAEIHEFVKKIPKLTKDFKSLNQHIHVAEHLKKQTDSRDFRERWQSERAMLEGEVYLDQVEELIYSDSLTSGGIRSNRFDGIRRLIVQTYGLPHMFTILNLEKKTRILGLLKRKETMLVVETTSTWQLLRKHFRLIDEKTNMIKPDDISYVAAGYAPLTARLVEFIGMQQMSSSIMEAMKLLPGPFLEVTQLKQPEELSDALLRNNLDLNGNVIGSTNTSTSALTSVMNGDISSLGAAIPGFRREAQEDSRKLNANFFNEESPSKKTMMIFIVGGVTLLEIAAFRYLSYEPNFPYRIVIASTKLINGSSFIKKKIPSLFPVLGIGSPKRENAIAHFNNSTSLTSAVETLHNTYLTDVEVEGSNTSLADLKSSAIFKEFDIIDHLTMPYSQEESSIADPASLLSLVHSSQFNSCLKGMNNETVISDSVQCITSFLSKHMTEEHHHSAIDHHSSYHLSNYFEFAVEFVNSIAGLIVLFAVFLACLNLMLVACNTATGLNVSIIDPLHSSHKGHKSNTVLRIRVILGEQIALALALLVASDILDTVLKPSHAYDLLDVVKMGFVTVLRTGLAYFLAKEIKELEEGSSGFRVCGGERNHQSVEIHEGKTSRRTSDSESEGGTSVKGAAEMGSTLRRTEDSGKLRKRKN